MLLLRFLALLFSFSLNPSNKAMRFSGKLRSAGIPELYHPETIAKQLPDDYIVPSNFLKGSPGDTAIAVVQHELGLGDGEVGFTSGYDTDIAEYAYLFQQHNGLPIVNTAANLAIVHRDGEKHLVTLNTSFLKTDDNVKFADAQPTIGPEAAIEAAHKAVSGLNAAANAQLGIKYCAQSEKNVALIYVVPLRSGEIVEREIYVDAHNAEVIGSVDFVSS